MLHPLKELKSLSPSVSLRVHNYFPPPHEAFALNLASENNEVVLKSLRLYKTAIQLAHDLGDSIYALHAGFLMDPRVSELGRKIEKRTLANRGQALNLFSARLIELVKFAKPLGVRLLVENNVLSQANFNEFNQNPLLLVDPVETRDFLESMGDQIGLLVDVAHLKVSAKTLKFDPSQMFKLCDPWIEGYHLSDNNGSADSNDSIGQDAWFWPFLKTNVGYYTIEVYGKDGGELYRQWKLVNECLQKK
jgi:sugar phosphate isomerase/epimerase